MKSYRYIILNQTVEYNTYLCKIVYQLIAVIELTGLQTSVFVCRGLTYLLQGVLSVRNDRLLDALSVWVVCWLSA
jgi:hypothetical protein